jgi:hypothetical protein
MHARCSLVPSQDGSGRIVGNPKVIHPPKGIAGTITKRSSRLLSINQVTRYPHPTLPLSGFGEAVKKLYFVDHRAPELSEAQIKDLAAISILKSFSLFDQPDIGDCGAAD